MALLLVQLGPQTAQVLRILGLLVYPTGLTLADPFVMVETFSVLFLPALDIPVSLAMLVISWGWPWRDTNSF